jgi:hypothetical protein
MSSAKTLFVLITALNILLCAGCRKKPVEQPKPDSETAKQQPEQLKTEQLAPEAQNQQPTVPLTAAPPAAVEQTNQSAHVQQQQKKETLPSPSLIKRPEKTAPSAADITSKTEPQEPINLNQFASLKSPEEKTDWISEFADANPDQISAMAETAMSDPSAEVRKAALDAIIENETPSPAAVAKAMTDSDEEVREKAVEASQFIDDEQAGDILIKALNDQSESVRATALDTVDEKNDDTKLSVYKAGITSQYADVKDEVVSALSDMSSPPAVDVLIEGLNDRDADFRDDVIQAIDFLIDHECSSYGECKSWWNANRYRFDNELNEKD